MPDRPKPPSFAELKPFVHSGGGLLVTSGYHWLGILLTWCFARIGASPNAVTLLSTVLSTAAGVIILLPGGTSWTFAIVSFILVAVGYATDCSDGQLARSTKSGSTLGAWLDHTVDAWKILFLNAALGWVCISRADAGIVPLWAAYLAPVLSITGNIVYAFGWNYKVMLAGKDTVAASIGSNSVKSILKLPLHITDFGVFLFLWFALPLEGTFTWIFLGYSALCAPIYLGYLAISAHALRKH